MLKHVNIIVFLLSAIFSSGAIAQTAKDSEAKISMLKAFYAEYITANAKEDASEQEVEAILKKYLTTRFFNEYKKLLDETDYDPFVSAQEYDIEWLKSLQVEPAATFNVFRVTYDMGFEDELALVRPVVAKEKGKFKIDGIKND